MLIHLYLRGDRVYLPTMVLMQTGYYVGIEPVRVLPATNALALQNAIVEVAQRGNAVVPTSMPLPKPPVLLKYANVKSWSAFEKKALFWAIEDKAEIYQITPGRKRTDKGWEDDPDHIESFPPGTTLDTVAQRLAALVLLAVKDTR